MKDFWNVIYSLLLIGFAMGFMIGIMLGVELG
jgi:hypothetical protein